MTERVLTSLFVTHYLALKSRSKIGVNVKGQGQRSMPKIEAKILVCSGLFRCKIVTLNFWMHFYFIAPDIDLVTFKIGDEKPAVTKLKLGRQSPPKM